MVEFTQGIVQVFPKKLLSAALERTFIIIINNTSVRKKKGKKNAVCNCGTSKNMKIKCEI